MKLIPKAKPVKIRIKSGGEEHSSLDSLLHNFNVRDIEPLLDGRLTRWLKHQMENELAELVDGIDASNLQTVHGLMYLMKIFYPEYIKKNGINDLLALTESWLKSSFYRKNGENLLWPISCLWDDSESLEIVKYLYKHKEDLNISETWNWYFVFDMRIDNEDEDKTDPEVLYIVGKMLWEGYQFNDFYVKEPDRHYKGDPDGLEMIEKAARLGCQEANLFIFEYNRKQKEGKQETTNKNVYTSRFDGINKERIRDWLGYNWIGGYQKETISYSTNDYENDKERIMLDFLCLSYRLGYMSERFGFEKTLQLALSCFANRDDILEKEKSFIIGLLSSNISWAKAKTFFTQIRDYKLANYMLGNTRIIDGLDFKSMSFQNQLSFIKDHLFDYE